MSPVAQYVLQSGITLLGVVALAWLILYGSRRLGPRQLRGPMELLGRLPLDQRRAVCLVKIGEKVLVLGASEAGISKLAELPASELPPIERQVTRSFAAVLERVGRQTGANPLEPPSIGQAGAPRAISEDQQ